MLATNLRQEWLPLQEVEVLNKQVGVTLKLQA